MFNLDGFYKKKLLVFRSSIKARLDTTIAGKDFLVHVWHFWDHKLRRDAHEKGHWEWEYKVEDRHEIKKKGVKAFQKMCKKPCNQRNKLKMFLDTKP